MDSFARSAILLFLALRVGDFVGVAAGMWFVPRYVSPEDIGAMPNTDFTSVDFPQPLGPIMPVILPFSTTRFTPCSISRLPY